MASEGNYYFILFDQNFVKGDQQTLRATVNQYFPPVAGSLCLLMKLLERIRFPVEFAKLCDHPLITAKMESELKSKYQELESLIVEKEMEIFNAWAETVPEILETHLSKPLFRVGEDKLLELNFDIELTNLLREIRYMIIMKRTDLSEEAINFFDRSEFYFRSTYDLNLIVNW
ncbi:dynein beta chain, ciliary-like [Augochlora pura]